MNKLKKIWMDDGIIIIIVMFVIMFFALMFHAEEKPREPMVTEIALEDGTRCVILNGVYSDEAITCEWSNDAR